jgi:hypothetical protein
MREPRVAVMILGEASWEDPGGVVQTAHVCMEDRSTGGACLRVKARIGVGSKLSVRCRQEQFTGISKYCRNDGKEFLVGIERDKTTSVVADMRDGEVRVSQKPPGTRLNKSDEIPEANPDAATAAVPCSAPVILEKAADAEVGSSEKSPLLQAHALRLDPTAEESPKAHNARATRKPMRSKLLELAHWHTKKETFNGNDDHANGNGSAHPSSAAAKMNSDSPGVSRLQVELLSTEDIYRTAGIMNLRGHSVHKVVEMLRSEHIRGLSKELKRAAVLMALDAAGIPVDQLLQDAKARQQALDSYEAEQQKQFEAEWSRKAEENVQIEAELEQVKAQYRARISRNLESVEREKATFSSWLTTKRQESQSIAEAVETCLTTSNSKSDEALLAPVVHQ